MKLLKAFFYVIFILIALAVAIPVALMIFVNPNQFKSQIEKEASSALHRPFTLQGNLHWTVYPTLGIKAEDLSIGNPASFPQGDFLSAKFVEFSVAFQPLLHKEVRVGKILIDGLDLRLIKNSKGQANWDTASTDTSNSGATKKSKSHQNSSSSVKVAAFSVSEIMIKNSTISMDDATKDKHFKITNFNFSSSDVSANQSFPMKLSMTVVDNILAAPLNLKWESNIKISPAQSKVTLTNIRATVNNAFSLTGDESIIYSNTPAWRANVNLSNINIQNVLKLFKKDSLDISGIGTVSASLQGAGSTRNLNGSIKFAVQNGIFHGMDLYYYADMADSLSNKQPPKLSNTQQTPFESLTGTAQIRSGVLENNDLFIKATRINASGQGTANLNTAQLDYRLSLQRMTSGTTISPRGPAIPLTITGDFSKPSVNVDVTSLAVSEVKKQIADKVQEYAPQINKKLAEGIQSLLGN